MNKLVAETEGNMNFSGVIPKGAKKMTKADQMAPIAAEGLDKLGM